TGPGVGAASKNSPKYQSLANFGDRPAGRVRAVGAMRRMLAAGRCGTSGSAGAPPAGNNPLTGAGAVQAVRPLGPTLGRGMRGEKRPAPPLGGQKSVTGFHRISRPGGKPLPAQVNSW